MVEGSVDGQKSYLDMQFKHVQPKQPDKRKRQLTEEKNGDISVYQVTETITSQRHTVLNIKT